MSAEAAFQDAVLAHLSADAGVAAALGPGPRIYDAAPEGAAFPYLTLGRGVSEVRDAQDADLIEHRLSLHLWTRDMARRDTKHILGLVRAALHEADLTLSGGHTLVSCRVVYADVFRTSDNRLAHGVLRVRAIFQVGG